VKTFLQHVDTRRVAERTGWHPACRSGRCAGALTTVWPLCRSLIDTSPASVESAARVLGTICIRSGLAGVNRPWYRVRCAANLRNP
jgi:hypothetical protein